MMKPRPPKSNKELVKMININLQYPDQQISIGVQLEPHLRKEMEMFLWKNISIFAWTIEDMVGIDLKVTMHELNIDPMYKLIRQKR